MQARDLERADGGGDDPVVADDGGAFQEGEPSDLAEPAGTAGLHDGLVQRVGVVAWIASG